MPSPKHTLWSRLVAVALPFFRSEVRGRALLALGLLVGLLLAINGLNVVNSYVGRDFMSALAVRQLGRFYALAGAWTGVFAASTLVEVLARYTQDRLGLLWRDWLTGRLLDRYVADRAFHRLEGRPDLDNPDQRISQDVATFTASTLGFLVLGFNALLTLLAFAGVLWSITPWLLLTAVLYATAGTAGTVLLGRRLVPLNNLQLQKEADFRFALGRVREHAEAVAQLASERAERARLGGRLKALVDNFREIIRVNRNLGFFTTGYNYLPQIIPVVVAAPLYMRGQVEFGTVTQAAMAFNQVLGAFSLIVTQFQQLSAFAAVVRRLGTLWEATESAPAPAAPAGPAVEDVPDGRAVAYQGLTLRTPKDGRPLVRDLSLEVPEGKRVLVTGPDAEGRAALFQATAGLWEGGQGRVVRPGRPDGLRFLRRRPPAVPGRLRDLLLYGLDGDGIPDDRLRDVLRQVGLETLAEQPGGLDAERDWPNVLSDGERQALAFARLLLANPRFACVDCPAGVLDAPQVERIYAALAGTSITYISVGDDPALAKYHDLWLILAEDGTWRVEPAGAAPA
jgi:vitamin B12/bleomycin/antimicrobial peptide transport system ATP-binding/permease protein